MKLACNCQVVCVYCGHKPNMRLRKHFRYDAFFRKAICLECAKQAVVDIKVEYLKPILDELWVFGIARLPKRYATCS